MSQGLLTCRRHIGKREDPEDQVSAMSAQARARAGGKLHDIDERNALINILNLFSIRTSKSHHYFTRSST